MSDVTRLLAAIQQGDSQATAELLPIVYDELRQLARAKLASERPDHTLQATALVHEAYLRLVGDDDPHWHGRPHFFAAAAEAMRRILVENARHKSRLRHGGQLDRRDIDIDANCFVTEAADQDLLAVHEALDALDATDPQAAQVVKLHFFLGMSFAELAQMLGISERAAYRTWSFARAWLFRRLRDHSA
jgi:RNA polymerase sigma factor (TIGR02999 family)